MAFRRMCTRWGCGKEVPAERAHRSPFCSDDCRRADKNDRREDKHKTHCSACGRIMRKAKDAVATIKSSHPRQCELCDGTKWVRVQRIEKGGVVTRVTRCPNWKIERLDASLSLTEDPNRTASNTDGHSALQGAETEERRHFPIADAEQNGEAKRGSVSQTDGQSHNDEEQGLGGVPPRAAEESIPDDLWAV